MMMIVMMMRGRWGQKKDDAQGSDYGAQRPKGKRDKGGEPNYRLGF